MIDMSRILCLFVCLSYVLTDEIKFNLTRHLTPAPIFKYDHSNVFVCVNDKSTYSFRDDVTVVSIRLHSNFKLIYVNCDITMVDEPSVPLISHFNMTTKNYSYDYNIRIDLSSSLHGLLKCMFTASINVFSEQITLYWATPTCVANIIRYIKDPGDKDDQHSPVAGYIGVLGVPLGQVNDTELDLQKTLIEFEQHKTVIEFDENFIFNIKCYSISNIYSGVITRDVITWRNNSWPTINSTTVAKDGANIYEVLLKLNDEASEYKCVDTMQKKFRTFKLVTRKENNKDLSADSNYTLIILACGAAFIGLTGLILCWKFKVLQRFKKWCSIASIPRPRAPTPPLYAQPYKVEYEAINYDECQIQTNPRDLLQHSSNSHKTLESSPMYSVPKKNTEPDQVNWNAPDYQTPTELLADSDQIWENNDGYQIVP